MGLFPNTSDLVRLGRLSQATSAEPKEGSMVQENGENPGPSGVALRVLLPLLGLGPLSCPNDSSTSCNGQARLNSYGPDLGRCPCYLRNVRIRPSLSGVFRCGQRPFECHPTM